MYLCVPFLLCRLRYLTCRLKHVLHADSWMSYGRYSVCVMCRFSSEECRGFSLYHAQFAATSRFAPSKPRFAYFLCHSSSPWQCVCEHWEDEEFTVNHLETTPGNCRGPKAIPGGSRRLLRVLQGDLRGSQGDPAGSSGSSWEIFGGSH